MDINKIKQKLDAFQAQSQQKSNILWKAPSGKSQVRLVEYKHNKDVPFVELYFHFNITADKKPILSPISYGEPDPIVEFSTKLRKTGSKEDFILAKKLEPKIRIFAPVVVRGEENEGVRIWGFSKTVAGELMSFIIDPDYGNIADANDGRDIVIETQTPLESGTQFGKTSIRVKPNKTSLSNNAGEVARFLDQQPKIDDLYKRYTYDELKDVLKNYLEPTVEDTVVEKTVSKVATTSKSNTSNLEDVNAAFDNIFNN